MSGPSMSKHRRRGILRLLPMAILAGSLWACEPQPGLSAIDVTGPAGIGRITNDHEGNSLVFDYDLDGFHDLLLGRHGQGAWELFHNDGDDTFSLAQLFTVADRHRCASADFSADGLPDVYCTVGAETGTSNTKTNELWLQSPEHAFSKVADTGGASDNSGRGRDVAAFEFNQDSIPDLFVGNAAPFEFPSHNRLFVNGGSLFTDTPTTGATAADDYGYCVAPGDFDQDRSVDLFVCGSVNRLYRNLDGADLVDVTASYSALSSERAWDADWGDVDGDGDLDLVTTSTLRVRVLKWDNASFSSSQTIEGSFRHSALGDADGDGDLDLFSVRTDTQVDQLSLNNANGQFTAGPTVPNASTGNGSNVAPFANYGGTGRTAFLVTNGYGPGVTGPRMLIAFELK